MNTPPYPNGDNVSPEQEDADVNNEGTTWLYLVVLLAVLAWIIWSV